jgi:hypothetical protein
MSMLGYPLDLVAHICSRLPTQFGVCGFLNGNVHLTDVAGVTRPNKKWEDIGCAGKNLVIL